jgi:hypothetical protein
MSKENKSEALSRRKALLFLGLGAALSIVVPTVLAVSGANAQEKAGEEANKSGTERRQERRTHRTERRQERRTHRTERRQERRAGREERREARRTGRAERHGTPPGDTTKPKQ